MLPLSHDPLAEDFHDNSRNAQPLFRMMVHVPYFSDSQERSLWALFGLAKPYAGIGSLVNHAALVQAYALPGLPSIVTSPLGWLSRLNCPPS